uniref:Uncharacterized protein n=1 Tax=Vespula pensylvanica TaxID=30213 RepID=A0A834PDE3_VESPE|nr:hypothetical protein H0235_003655 [Vespula pensylvanica]
MRADCIQGKYASVRGFIDIITTLSAILDEHRVSYDLFNDKVHILEGSEVSNGRVAGKQSIPLSVDSSEGRASFCYVALVEVSVVVWWYRRDVASTTTTVATTGPGY